ncbi:HAD family hydrolase [Enterococcus sp. BWT-B8]|uniref:HAD family hydrolase n=1 Tax=Enterococcus sp. BWT-B8 TaxID=2885157 RepID=UPI001E470571|nr:HAD family hydrolase [Enterococcus sp. BWT-B8]MCB5953305.1 HAD family hydrolase [Enterococcus sp. BWT-B8]
MTIKYIFCDIDGTLIQKREVMTEAFIKEVRRTTEKGIFFTFASGRLPYRIQPLLDVLGLSNQPYVACNGALVKKGQRILFQKKFSLCILRKLVEKALDANMTVLYAIDEIEYVMAENTATQRKRIERGTYHPLRMPTEAEWKELEIIKLNVLKDDSLQTIELFEEDFEEVKEDILITRYGMHGIELVSQGVNKQTGIEIILNELHGTQQEVATIGDNENDYEMIQAAALGIAVGNAIPELQEKADYNVSGIAIEGGEEALKKIRQYIERKNS